MYKVDELPKLIEIEPTTYCNYKCIMCHCSFLDMERKYIDISLFEKVLFDEVFYSISSGFEPFVHPEIGRILHLLSLKKVDYEIITNGSLVSDAHIKSIVDSNVVSITVSFDSIKPDVYPDIRRGGDYSRTLDRVSSLFESASSAGVFTAINATYMMSNYREISTSPDFWNERYVDQLRCIAMVVRENNDKLKALSLYNHRHDFLLEIEKAATQIIDKEMRISLSTPYLRSSQLNMKYPDNIVGNIAKSDNPDTRMYFNPRHRLLETESGVGVALCSAPFDFAKVFPNGDVQLCYQFTVGNLHKNTFKEIWFGREANRIRKMICTTPSICSECAFFRFCLKSDKIDLEDARNYENIA